MVRILILLLALLAAPTPLLSMEIVHGDSALHPVCMHTELPLIAASEEAASLGWMQMYVFHPDPAERKALLAAGRARGAMGILPAGTDLKLIAIARNGGAIMAEILSVGTGPTAAPAHGTKRDRAVPAADASYPFAIPPAPTVPWQLRRGSLICFDTADALAAIPALRAYLDARRLH